MAPVVSLALGGVGRPGGSQANCKPQDIRSNACRCMSVSGSDQTVACRSLHDRVGHCLPELTSMLDAWQCQDRANPRLQLFRRVDAASFDSLLPAFLEPRQLPPDSRRNWVLSRA